MDEFVKISVERYDEIMSAIQKEISRAEQAERRVEELEAFLQDALDEVDAPDTHIHNWAMIEVVELRKILGIKEEK